MKRYIFAYDVNTEAIQARRSFDDWVTYLAEDDDEVRSSLTTWDDVYDAVLEEHIHAGDYFEFVTMVTL